jgi:phosphoglycolate phosphatase-like HAD superfamily hydrolase
VADPRVLALDFDGVLCDGRREYFETAWRAYERCWSPAAVSAERRQSLAREFSSLRPLIESGWEFPLLIHALVSGAPIPAPDDREMWLALAQRLARESGVSLEQLKREVNEVRDAWFAAEPADWVAHHDFYPGVLERVQRAGDAGVAVAIITTKAERFVRALLAARAAPLEKLPILGWAGDRIVPKDECVRHLVATHRLAPDGAGVWFVEDMLETLEKIGHAIPPLAGLRRFLAAWGYNTPGHRGRAPAAGVTVIGLTRFCGDFAGWA